MGNANGCRQPFDKTMENRPTNLRLYLAVAATAILVALCVMAALYRNSAPTAMTQPAPAALPGALPASYEDTVRDEQHRWGHGHTLADPSPTPPGP